MFWLTKLVFLKLFKRKGNNENDYDEYLTVDKISGCCLMVKMVDNYDYFDNNIFLYCEESVLSKKIRSVNSCILYEPSTQAIHMHKNGSRSNSFRQFMYWCESRIYYIENYSDFFQNLQKKS